ncbi:MAG: hypothetical protein ACWGQW_16835 [bacterium]
MLVVFHANLAQPHQIEHGEWLTKGFGRHGIKFEVTADIHKEADVHVVSGPHYAKNQWLGAKTIWLDKRFYKEDVKPIGMFSDPCVSLGWMTPTGGRVFTRGEGKEPPEIETHTGCGTIYLCNYGEIAPQGYDAYRRHPDEEKPADSLRQALESYQKAAGRDTTSLIAAALMGLDIECLDPDYILNDPDWLEKLPYADWSYKEIVSGEAIDHLWHEL